LAVLKLYQFKHAQFDLETTRAILLKAMTAMPDNDFSLCLGLLSMQQQENPQVRGRPRCGRWGRWASFSRAAVLEATRWTSADPTHAPNHGCKSKTHRSSRSCTWRICWRRACLSSSGAIWRRTLRYADVDVPRVLLNLPDPTNTSPYWHSPRAMPPVPPHIMPPAERCRDSSYFPCYPHTLSRQT